MSAIHSPPAIREGVRGSAAGSDLPDGIYRLPGGGVRLVGFAAIREYVADTCPGCPDCAPQTTARDVSELR